MNTTLNNTVSALGNYNNIPTSITSLVSVVIMISGLTITKTADKEVWADGLLTYNTVLDNEATETYVSPVVTDKIDTSFITFVAGSVTIDGTEVTSSEYTYEESTGTLKVNPTDITPSSKKTITFQVTKK